MTVGAGKIHNKFYGLILLVHPRHGSLKHQSSVVTRMRIELHAHNIG